MELTTFFSLALKIIFSGQYNLYEIVFLSLYVSMSGVLFATLIALPLGTYLATSSFPGKPAVIVIVNALMGLPPVVVGLMVYLMLSRTGPLGVFGLLYTPTAMIIAQTILIVPIITALTRQTVEHLSRDYDQQLRLFGVSPMKRTVTLIVDGRFELLTAVLAGLGRAMGEVGAVMIVGGNIDHFTRVMTTSITLETSRGNLAVALALGMILILLTIIINGVIAAMRYLGEKKYV